MSPGFAPPALAANFGKILGSRLGLALRHGDIMLAVAVAGGAYSAAAAMAARRQPRVLDQLFGADPSDRVVRRETTRLYRLPDRPAAGDDGSPRPPPGLYP